MSSLDRTKSPPTPSNSWIVRNISSLISSSNDDDAFMNSSPLSSGECTLVKNDDSNDSSSSSSGAGLAPKAEQETYEEDEVERARPMSHNDEIKRQLSPEEINVSRQQAKHISDYFLDNSSQQQQQQHLFDYLKSTEEDLSAVWRQKKKLLTSQSSSCIQEPALSSQAPPRLSLTKPNLYDRINFTQTSDYADDYSSYLSTKPDQQTASGITASFLSYSSNSLSLGSMNNANGNLQDLSNSVFSPNPHGQYLSVPSFANAARPLRGAVGLNVSSIENNSNNINTNNNSNSLAMNGGQNKENKILANLQKSGATNASSTLHNTSTPSNMKTINCAAAAAASADLIMLNPNWKNLKNDDVAEEPSIDVADSVRINLYGNQERESCSFDNFSSYLAHSNSNNSINSIDLSGDLKHIGQQTSNPSKPSVGNFRESYSLNYLNDNYSLDDSFRSMNYYQYQQADYQQQQQKQFHHHQQQQQQQQQLNANLSKLALNNRTMPNSGKPVHPQKKITKSSTTIFRDNTNSFNYANHLLEANAGVHHLSYLNEHQYNFGHSNSYDNFGQLRLNAPGSKPLRGRSKLSNLLAPETNGYLSGSTHSINLPLSNSSSSIMSSTSCNSSNASKRSTANNSNNTNPTSGWIYDHQQSTPNTQQGNGDGKNHITIHVKNLDYKISADEWRRILSENFRKHCKEILSVNVVTNADKSLLGVVKLGSKDDARLAISCLHHKKIGYKRLNVNIAFSPTTNSPRSKIVALLKSNDSNEMALTRFIELYESRYNQNISVSELFKLKDIVHIAQDKEGQGRLIKLTAKNYQNNLENEMQELLHTPYCTLHSSRVSNDPHPNIEPHASSSVAWLPNVIVSIRAFKSAVHKLLNDHGGQMPLLSFMDCYKCCIFNEMTGSSSSSNGAPTSNATKLVDQLLIDNDNGVPLEHLITCAQDVQIQYNEGFYKQLQWENDKSKPANLQTRTSSSSSSSSSAQAANRNSNDNKYDLLDFYFNFSEVADDLMEESQRKLNQFTHEIVELFKGIPRALLPISKFNNEYQKKYGKQCRVADYGCVKLYELLESLPHVLQIIDAEFEKKITLTHRVQVRRFSNDLVKVLKSHPSKQMFADEFPLAFEKHFNRAFDIRDYGVCYLEDMLAELPDSIISRKEIDGRTFVQIPKLVQADEERCCMARLANDIVDMLKHKPRFSIQFSKFIPNFHHHFGRQCKLSNYGFTKLIELLEAMPDTVQLLVKDGIQFVQLKRELMMDVICQNLVRLLDESTAVRVSMAKLEELYNTRYEPVYYADFECDRFAQLLAKLPVERNFLRLSVFNHQKFDYKTYVTMNGVRSVEFADLIVEVDELNEREVKRTCRLMLKRLMDECEDTVCKLASQSCGFRDLWDVLFTQNGDISNEIKASFNDRSYRFALKCLNDYFNFRTVNKRDDVDGMIIVGLSDLYLFGKQIRHLFKSCGALDLSLPELEMLYKQTFKNGLNGGNRQQQQQHQQQQQQQPQGFPFKQLGYVDAYLLFTQGLSLMVTIKKFSDKRVCLNREFWPKNMLEVDQINPADSISPVSPHSINVNNNHRYINSCKTPNSINSQRVSPLFSNRLTPSFSSVSNLIRRSNPSSHAANNNYHHNGSNLSNTGSITTNNTFDILKLKNSSSTNDIHKLK